VSTVRVYFSRSIEEINLFYLHKAIIDLIMESKAGVVIVELMGDKVMQLMRQME
jgi:hypothetical protein